MNEPTRLWGALAVVVPIAIHFWHRRQGKLLPWAATLWLEQKQQQQSRGFRLDNLWLMLLRCLLVVMLAVLLAQPVWHLLQKPPVVQPVHLVQPSAAVVDNFRFELSEALKRNERVVWATPALLPVSPALALPDRPTVDPLTLQTAITRLSTQPIALHLYALNTQTLSTVPTIAVPAQFALHTVVDSSQQPRPFLLVKNGRRLYLDRAGKLVSMATPDAAVRLATSPVHTGPIPTLLSYQNAPEKKTVRAALAALTDVYAIDFQLDDRPVAGRSYTWVLTDRLPDRRSASTLYIVSPGRQSVGAANIVYTGDVLTPATSERVETGQLPEWLGAQLLAHFNLNTRPMPLTQPDLRAMFSAGQPTPRQASANWQQGLLLVFISLILVERWVSLTKNA